MSHWHAKLKIFCQRPRELHPRRPRGYQSGRCDIFGRAIFGAKKSNWCKKSTGLPGQTSSLIGQSAGRISTTSGTRLLRKRAQGLFSPQSKLSRQKCRSPENIASSRLEAPGSPRMREIRMYKIPCTRFFKTSLNKLAYVNHQKVVRRQTYIYLINQYHCVIQGKV